MRRRIAQLCLATAVCAASLWLFSKTEVTSMAQPDVVVNATSDARGAAAFEGAGFGGISMDAMQSHALPWRLVAAALVLDAQSKDPALGTNQMVLNGVLSRFGFLPNATVGNRPQGVRVPARTMPFGFTFGDLAPVGGTKVRVSNLGCAACHAGVTYRSDGSPNPDVAWLGMPNTSLNLETYTVEVFRALKKGLTKPKKLLTAARTLFPDMGWRERTTLEWIVLPLVRKRLSELGAANAPLPFPNGVPGSTNGVGALKFKFGVPLAGNGRDDAGIVSIPDLGDRYLRTSLLVDGSYFIPGGSKQAPTTAQTIGRDHLKSLAAITTFFTVPSMGVDPDNAITHLDKASDIFSFLHQSYRPQTFPGPIDKDMAARGSGIYDENCSRCHGSYGDSVRAPRLKTFPNWLGVVGTDPLRAALFTDKLVERFKDTAYRSIIDVTRTRKYAAPPLTGIWASAPYLHNGSVPTLFDLLTPSDRPERFQLGGHALNFERGGIRIEINGSFPRDYKPFSKPVWFDSKVSGQSNAGHRFGEMLPEDQKRQLIEYLKLL